MDLGVRSSLLPLSCLSILQYLCLLSRSPFSINSNPFISYVCKSISHVSLYLVTHRVKVKAERVEKVEREERVSVLSVPHNPVLPVLVFNFLSVVSTDF